MPQLLEKLMGAVGRAALILTGSQMETQTNQAQPPATPLRKD